MRNAEGTQVVESQLNCAQTRKEEGQQHASKSKGSSNVILHKHYRHLKEAAQQSHLGR